MICNNSLPRPSSGGLGNFEPTKCQQHLAKFQDINNMVQRYLAGDTSVLRKGTYGDFSKAPESLQEALNAQRAAIEAYESLPDSVRARYTSPEVFYRAALDPEQRQDFVKLGLAFDIKPDEPIQVHVINPVTSQEAK